MTTDTGTFIATPPARAVPGTGGAQPPGAGFEADAGAAMLRRLAPMFSALGLTAADAATLEREARARLVPAGQFVFRRGDAALGAVVLLQGDVALGMALADGQFRPERLVHAPAWLDLGSAWIESTHALDARAVSPATVAEVPLEVLQSLVERRSTMVRPLITALAREVRDLTLNTHELMHKDAPARLAAWLRQRCGVSAQAAEPVVVQLHERKRDIASQLAITPETLSRLMRSFMRQGVIDVNGYTVRVLDRVALERLAGDETLAVPA